MVGFGAMTHSFSQQTDESKEAFHAFAIYRDFGVTRSARAVAERLGTSEQLIARWRLGHSWVRRARSYDAEIDRKKRLIDLQGIERMRRRQIKLSLKLQALAAVELERLIERAMSQQQNGDPLSASEIVKLAECGAKLERLNRGEPGEIVETHISEGADLSQFSLERIKALRDMRTEIRAKQLADANTIDVVGEVVAIDIVK